MSNYSYNTSLPAYHDNQPDKQIQAVRIVNIVNDKKATCLKELAEALGIDQSTISARVNDLRKEGKVDYDDVIVYKDRKRKRIVPIQAA